MFKNKNVCVVGGTGLVGRQLLPMLIEAGAKLRVVSLDEPIGLPVEVEFKKLNILSMENCLAACDGMDMVFNLFGVKGSAKAAKEHPASYFTPTILGSINMMEAARVSGVKKYLFTSSIGVYAPAEVFYEDDVWKTFPTPNDRFAGWAKRMGELQAEAYKIEYGWDQIAIVRPANVYGPYDRFDLDTGMVIPSLIRRAMEENPLMVFGDGSEVRDFIHARDVARGMMLAMENATNCTPINLGSGTGVTIKDLAETICKNVPNPPKLEWDISKKAGDSFRVMDIARAREIGFVPEVSLEEGIKETIDWYLKNKNKDPYNVFKQKKFI